MRVEGPLHEDTALREIVEDAFGWLGVTWEPTPTGVRCEMKLDHYDGRLPGALCIDRVRVTLVDDEGWTFVVTRLNIVLDAQLPARGHALDIKPKQQGNAVPYSDAFSGGFPFFQSGDVEIDRIFNLQGSADERPLAQTLVHPLRQLRKNEGSHEGFVRVDLDRMRIVVEKLPRFSKTLGPTMAAFSELWRLASKGPVDGFVPLDLAPEVRPGKPARPVRPRLAYKISNRPEHSKSEPWADLEKQRQTLREHAGHRWSMPLDTSSPLALTAADGHRAWRVDWTGGWRPSIESVSCQFYSLDPFVFDICHEDFLHQIGKLFGFGEVEVGITTFDKTYFIQCNDAGRLRSLVENAKDRARLYQVPLSAFRLQHVPGGPAGLKRLSLRIETPWTWKLAAQKKALDVVETMVNTLAPLRPQSPPACLDAVQAKLAALPGAVDDGIRYTNGVARSTFAFDRFVSTLEAASPHLIDGTVTLRLTGRGQARTQAFEIASRGRDGSPPLSIPGAPPLPPASVDTGFPSELRRMHVRSLPHSVEVVKNMVRPIDILVDSLNYARVVVRMSEGEIGLAASEVPWDAVPEIGRVMLDLWKALVAVQDERP